MTEKDAGIRDFMHARLLRNADRAADRAEAIGRSGLLRGDPSGPMRWFAGLVDPNAPPDKVTGMSGSAVGGAARGAKNVLDVALRPGQSPVFEGANQALSKIPKYPLILAGVGIPATVAGLQDASEESTVLRRLTEAQAMGELPMSDVTFNRFMQRRKHGAAQEKTAAGRLSAIGNIAGQGMGALDDLLKKLLYSTDNVTGHVADLARKTRGAQGMLPGFEPTPQEMLEAAGGMDNVLARMGAKGTPEAGQQIFEQSVFSPGKALGVAGAGLGLGTAADVLGEPAVGGLQNMLGLGEQPDYAHEAMQSFARETGKQTGGMMGDLTRMLAGGAAGMVQNIPLTREQRRVFGHALKADPLLSGATDHEIHMLEKAFKSMMRFAPELATDEFAVRNYLREALMSSSGGPDYGTLANLARASQTIQGPR